MFLVNPNQLSKQVEYSRNLPAGNSALVDENFPRPVQAPKWGTAEEIIRLINSPLSALRGLIHVLDYCLDHKSARTGISHH